MKKEMKQTLIGLWLVLVFLSGWVSNGFAAGTFDDIGGTATATQYIIVEDSVGKRTTVDVGTDANDLVQLDGTSRLPAVDGSQLTGLPSVDVATVASIKALTDLAPVDDDIAIVFNFYGDGTVGGGGTFQYSASEDKANANGGTIIDPDTIGTWDGSQAQLTSQYYGSIWTQEGAVITELIGLDAYYRLPTGATLYTNSVESAFVGGFGADGDYGITSDTGKVIGPKAAGVWPIGSPIRTLTDFGSGLTLIGPYTAVGRSGGDNHLNTTTGAFSTRQVSGQGTGVGTGCWIRQNALQTPDEWGAVGSATLDETIPLQHMFAYYNSVGSFEISGKGKTHQISGAFGPDGIVSSSIRNLNFKAVDGLPWDTQYHLFYVKDSDTVVIENMTVDGNRANRSVVTANYEPFAHTLIIDSTDNITTNNVVAKNSVIDAFYIAASSPNNASYAGHSKFITMINCTADNSYRQGMSVIQAHHMRIAGGAFKGSTGTAPEAGIDFEPNAADGANAITDIVVDNVLIEGNAGYGIVTASINTPEQFVFNNIDFNDNALGAISLNSRNVTLSNSKARGQSTNPTRGIIDIGATATVDNISIENFTFDSSSFSPTIDVPIIYIHGSASTTTIVDNFNISNLRINAGGKRYYPLSSSTVGAHVKGLRAISCQPTASALVNIGEGGTLIDAWFYGCAGRVSYITTDYLTYDNIMIEEHDDALPIIQIASNSANSIFNRIKSKAASAIAQDIIRVDTAYGAITNSYLNDSNGFTLTLGGSIEDHGFFRGNYIDGVAQTETAITP